MPVGIGLYVKGSAGAVELYKRAFGLTLGYHVKNSDGSYFHSELYRGEEELLSVVEADAPFPQNNPVQLGFMFDEKSALLAAFRLLSEGGEVGMEVCELPWSPCAAEVTDKYGIRWYLSLPQHRPADDFSPENYENSQSV